MINYVDIVTGLAWGDEAKGKVTSTLASSGNYNMVCRWSGGSNAGHTIYYKGQKYATHIVPCGIFYGIESIIGPACVVNKKSLFKEIKYLKEQGFDTSLIKVSPKAHMVLDSHIEEDKKSLSKKLGTTSSGIAPAYSAKMARSNQQAKDLLPAEMLWNEILEGNILCEGAQGIWLDIDQGNYPYVTSSTTLPYGACSLGFPTQKIRKIYGAAKIYDTRSGVDPDFPEDLLNNKDLKTIAHLGAEYGTTTGRPRKVNWLNLNKLIESINMTGTTDLIISKLDILESAKRYKLIENDNLKNFSCLSLMTSYIKYRIQSECPLNENIIFSSNPQTI